MKKSFRELNLWDELTIFYIEFLKESEKLKKATHIENAKSSLLQSISFIAEGYSVKEKLKDSFLSAISKLAEFQSILSIMYKNNEIEEEKYFDFISKTDLFSKKIFSYRKKVN